MTRQRMIACGLAAALFAATTEVSTAREKEATNRDRARAGKLDDKTSGANVRAETLIGLNIQNPQGKDVGEVKDLVIDAKSGKVRYAAVTYGGFLGIGNKMFAVPFKAFQCRQDAEDKDEYILVLDVTERQLKGDAGFDEDHWPDFADETFTGRVDKRYGVQRRGKVDVRVNTGVVDVDIASGGSASDGSDRAQSGKRDEKSEGLNIRATQVVGMNIQNQQGDGVGEVKDLVIDANAARVRYAAVTYGGFLGIGNKLFAVPFKAFQCRQDANDTDQYVLVLDVTEQQLEGAAGFDEDNWPDFADAKFTSQIDARYGVKRRMRNRDKD